MKKMITRIIASSLAFATVSAYSWNPLAHMVIANIAYETLTPKAKSTVDDLVNTIKKEYPDLTSYELLAGWPDTLHGQRIEAFSHWHYIDVAFTNDGTPLKNLMDTDNAVWAVNDIEPIVGNSKANPYERARFLGFLTHIVGDLHQPCHTVSLISSNHPDGDRGGNAYYVRYNGNRVNLHRLWDSGIDAFTGSDTPDHVNQEAKFLMKRYTIDSFGSAVHVLSPDDWVREGKSIAQKSVYNTKEDANISPDYIDIGNRQSERDAALAGYRLGIMLNELLDN